MILLASLLVTSSVAAIPITYEQIATELNEASLEIYIEEVARAQKVGPKNFSLYQLRGNAQQRAQDVLDQATTLYNLPRHELSTIRWSLKDHRAGAVSGCSARPIMFLNEILYIRNYDRFMNQTIPHEVAHIVACMLDPKRYDKKGYNPHDILWAEVMDTLGLAPTELHDMDVTPIDLYNSRVEAMALEYAVERGYRMEVLTPADLSCTLP